MSMRSKDFMDKDLYAEGDKIGKVKDVVIDTENWKVTHFDVELTRDAAELVLGAKKGGVRNSLAISALEKGTAFRTDKGINIKVAKKQLRTYMNAEGKQ